MKFFRKFSKHTAAFLAIIMLSQLITPIRAFAITGFNSMPEYRSFEPIATTNMVNDFDGSFTYNIPILDIPNGYPLSLSYHSGDVNTEAMSSWVGLGWTLNPGAINRVKRGFPDEFNGHNVTYYNKMERNWTVGAGASLGAEIFGNENFGGLNLNLGATISYNNYCGIKTVLTGGIGYAGMATLSFSYSNGQFGFDPSINPGRILSFAGRMVSSAKDKSSHHQDVKDKKNFIKDPGGNKLYETSKLKKKNTDKVRFNATMDGIGGGWGSGFSFASLPPTGYPVNASRYTGFALHLNVDIGINLFPIPIAPEGKLEGSFVTQANDASTDLPVYGYMNMEGATAAGNENSMMDYFTENDTPFEKRDNILGIPMPNNDIYNLTGEGMGGTFRPFRSEYGHYRKNHVKSETYSVQAGADVKLASIFPVIPPFEISNLVNSFGANLGGEYQYLSVGNWDSKGDASNYEFQSDANFPNSNEKFFFRFASDLGGNFDLSGNDNAYQASLNKSFLDATLELNNPISSTAIDSRSNKTRSAYVDYASNGDYSDKLNNVSYKVSERSLQILPEGGTAQAYNRSYYTGLNDGHGNTINKSIGELVTHNADGVKYVYGLPVYAKNEKELEYNLSDADYDQTDLQNKGGGLVAQITGDVAGHASRKLGYESSTPYATTYLLTQITSPDYVDRSYDGPSTDDYGNYSRFNYLRVAGGNNTWYSYRSPYKGVNYTMGSLSTKSDDMGSLSYGEKEVYYVKTIASKTHVAIFQMSNRDDGLSAKAPSTENDLIKGEGTTPAVSLKKLDRIDLYSINDVTESSAGSGVYTPKAGTLPMKTIHFEYDYSLCKGLLNNSNYVATNPSAPNSGKLTLKRVWFEYNGKATSKISPYVFSYSYPSNAATAYPSIYKTPYTSASNNLAAYASFTGAQNPEYNVLNTDRWGTYRNFNTLKTNLGDLSRFFPFVNQAPDPTADDPSAYMLKAITLPSGGEIHIQYEQNDYMHVQDKRAMMMVPIKGLTPSSELNLDGKRYYLDLAKAGINEYQYTPAQLETIARDMFEPMMGGQRIYFNFLYALLGSFPYYNYTESDYLEGYARINGFGHDAYGVYFTFKGNSGITSDFYQPVSSGYNKKEIPRQVCLNFYRTQRRGKISGQSSALEAAAGSGSGADVVKGFANLLASLANSFDDKCAAFQPEMSYVRVQVPVAKQRKLGGGVRVKRLLMFDNGVDGNGPNSLYGQEYKYTTKVNGVEVSSGVAANEPGIGRRESPLVNPIEKDEQTKAEAILYGKDMYSQEGPLGESLLPGPSVGYSEVCVSNIYTGVTSPGSEVHEFYTWKDFPFRATRTSIDQAFTKKLGISAGASVGKVGVSVSYSREDPYMTQGYAFVSQDMNGHPKRVAKFANGVTKAPMMEELYEYFQPGDNIKVMNNDMSIATVPFSDLGKESEMLSEMRQVEDVAVGGDVGVDFSAGPSFWYIPPVLPAPIPTLVLSGVDLGFHMAEKILRTHVTTKIISYPAIVKKVTSLSDGIHRITENDVLDRQTGSPVIVKNYDDFSGTYLNQDFLASWSYSGMRSKAINQKMKATGTYSSDANGPFLQLSASDLQKFTEGDFVEVKSASTAMAFHVKNVNVGAGQLRLYPSQLNGSSISTGTTVNALVVNSGYSNELNIKCGNIVLHSSNGAPLPITNMPNLNGNNSFISDLNTKLNALTLSNGSSGIILMNNTSYVDMDISNYKLYLPPACATTADRASISNIKISYTVVAGNLKLTLKSFQVDCNPVVVIACQ